MADSYGGVLGAFPYAFRTSRSRLFRSYVVVGSLAALALTALFVLALVVLVAATTTVRGGSLSLSRSFFVLIALCLVAPTVAPVLFVARSHRRAAGRSDQYDAALAVSGYLFLVSLYVGLLATVPAAFQASTAGPAVGVLYSLPAAAGLVPPLVAAAGILAAHRFVD